MATFKILDSSKDDAKHKQVAGTEDKGGKKGVWLELSTKRDGGHTIEQYYELNERGTTQEGLEPTIPVTAASMYPLDDLEE